MREAVPGRVALLVRPALDALTPDMCSIRVFVREGAPARSAQAGRTRLGHEFHSETWNLLADKAGAGLLKDNTRQIGAPEFTDADHALARALLSAARCLAAGAIGLVSDVTQGRDPAGVPGRGRGAARHHGRAPAPGDLTPAVGPVMRPGVRYPLRPDRETPSITQRCATTYSSRTGTLAMTAPAISRS
ncbi:hypothetical protein AB0P05_40410 [Streptomyces flaveolus]|uniref:hypothetical protein n=1 Tax=Streptomyces flaveolus TaxID=67297 RepID=UPI00344261CC